jgi:hypothetical protein
MTSKKRNAKTLNVAPNVGLSMFYVLYGPCKPCLDAPVVFIFRVPHGHQRTLFLEVADRSQDEGAPHAPLPLFPRPDS